MFGIIADLLSSVLTVLFPIFASYKALRTSDVSQIAPWLMYWVVLSIVLLVESWTFFIVPILIAGSACSRFRTSSFLKLKVQRSYISSVLTLFFINTSAKSRRLLARRMNVLKKQVSTTLSGN
ncbi:hypothetical protein CPSG_09897, partial [Coccidioides posadasii str. Silveira]